jgi:hypothetical protein
LQAKQFSEQLYAAQQTAAAHKAEAQQLQAKANSPMLSAFISFANFLPPSIMDQDPDPDRIMIQ